VRPEAALADRRREVRLAARGWRRAGAIDDATLAAVEAAYPDDRARLGPVFRVVAFVAGLLALNAFFGVIAIASHGASAFGVACLVFGLLLAGATELLVGPLKRADSGIETATALLAVVYGVVAFGALFARTLGNDRVLVATLLVAAVTLSLLGSVRWGSRVLAAVAAACVLLFLARLPGGRLCWLAAGAALTPPLLRASEDARFAPSQRRSFRVGAVLGLLAVYAAVHLGSWDHGWLEWLADFRGDAPTQLPFVRSLSILATALMPAVVAGVGVATRRTWLLALGVLLAVASLVTLRFYVHVAPLWAVLAVSGLAALAAALLLRRLLASGRGGERGGFTADALFEDPGRRAAAEVVGALATFSPLAQAGPAEPGARGLEPGGGRYGGGGASGSF
jgi:hypothetical protein